MDFFYVTVNYKAQYSYVGYIMKYKAQYCYVRYVVTQVCLIDYGYLMSLSTIRLSTSTFVTLLQRCVYLTMLN